jgi:pyruvate dehydrogenase E2 component (dihydrolipoamide acetyltransferase)
MIIEFKLPELGENISYATVSKIMVKVGQLINKDEPVIELETDKATLEVPSPNKGIVKGIRIRQGQQVTVGQILLLIDTNITAKIEPMKPERKLFQRPTEGESKISPQGKTTPLELKTPTPSEAKAVSEISQKPNDGQPAAASSLNEFDLPEIRIKETEVPASPSVRALARELGIDITKILGTGPDGRISLEDVKSFAKDLRAGKSPKKISNTPAPILDKSSAQASVALSPRKYTLATKSATPSPQEGLSQPLPNFEKWGEVERKPMTQIRLRTAEKMTLSWLTVPLVTQFGKADITDLEELRKKHSPAQQKLTITSFIIKVAADALKAFPQFNVSIDLSKQDIIFKKYIHVGVAVDTPHGLVVPVIRDADKKNIVTIAQELNDLAQRARDKKLTLEDMQGATFTVTNLGGLGGSFFTPIVNWPEVAILGISRAETEYRFINNQGVPRLILPLALSYDHRAVDGADGARFMAWFIETIQKPSMVEFGE